MSVKQKIYLKKFIVAFLLVELTIILSLVLFITSPFFDGTYTFILLLCFIIEMISITITFLLYIHDPDPKKLVSKDRFIKIGNRQGLALLFFSLSSVAGYIFSNIAGRILPSFPMPITFFYGHLVIFLGIIWFILFHKEVKQIFDVIDVYIKDELYFESWPAEIRRKDRSHDLRIRNKQEF